MQNSAALKQQTVGVKMAVMGGQLHSQINAQIAKQY